MARDEKRNASDLGDLTAGLTDDGAPVDLAAVRRDDALIEAISSGGHVSTDSTEQYELALILAKWRDDVVSTPMPQGPLLDDVIAAIEATPPVIGERSRSRLRLLRPVAAAAAVAAVVFGGGSMLAYDAQPGDALWGVKQVVFAEEANSTVAKIDTTSELEKAERLLVAGDIPEAKKVLDNAAQRADDVKDSPEKNDLVERWGKLMTQVEETGTPVTPPQTTTPGDQSPTPSAPATPTQPGLPALTVVTTTPSATSTPNPAVGTPTENPSSTTGTTSTTTTTTPSTTTPSSPPPSTTTTTVTSVPNSINTPS